MAIKVYEIDYKNKKTFYAFFEAGCLEEMMHEIAVLKESGFEIENIHKHKDEFFQSYEVLASKKLEKIPKNSKPKKKISISTDSPHYENYGVV